MASVLSRVAAESPRPSISVAGVGNASAGYDLPRQRSDLSSGPTLEGAPSGAPSTIIVRQAAWRGTLLDREKREELAATATAYRKLSTGGS